MAIDIDWAGTDPNPYRIFIPRLDMPIVQVAPEIRELNIDQFRKDLRTLEAAVPGGPWPETHEHNTQKILSGLAYARIVEILFPYIVEFEDGQYAVRTTGANHNLLDVKVANQVSLLVQNSAGLVNIVEIQEMHRFLGLDINYVVEHGQTYIRVPEDGSLINILVTKTPTTTKLERV